MRATIFKTSGDGSQDQIGIIEDADGVEIVSGSGPLLDDIVKRYKTVTDVVEDHSNSSRIRVLVQ